MIKFLVSSILTASQVQRHRPPFHYMDRIWLWLNLLTVELRFMKCDETCDGSKKMCHLSIEWCRQRSCVVSDRFGRKLSCWTGKRAIFSSASNFSFSNLFTSKSSTVYTRRCKQNISTLCSGDSFVEYNTDFVLLNIVMMQNPQQSETWSCLDN